MPYVSQYFMFSSTITQNWICAIITECKDENYGFI